jgi:hypothetical protein
VSNFKSNQNAAQTTNAVALYYYHKPTLPLVYDKPGFACGKANIYNAKIPQ